MGQFSVGVNRLYHPVVAEKAREAWQAKLEQRHRTECARIKKHNDRHGTQIPRPTLDDWLSLGCPLGRPLLVPRDKLGCPSNVPRETPSKGQGEGQGQGQGQGIEEKDTHTAGATFPDVWVLTKTLRDEAIDEFPHWTPEAVASIARQFADHHRSAGTLSCDWDAAWRKWTRDDLTQRAHPPLKAPRAAAAPATDRKTVRSHDTEATQRLLAEQQRAGEESAAATPEQRTAVAERLHAAKAVTMAAIAAKKSEGQTA